MTDHSDFCPLGTQLLIEGAPPGTEQTCPVCDREWFIGAVTECSPERTGWLARLRRWISGGRRG